MAAASDEPYRSLIQTASAVSRFSSSDSRVTTAVIGLILSASILGCPDRPVTYPVIFRLPVPKGASTIAPSSTCPASSSGTWYWNGRSSAFAVMSTITSAYNILYDQFPFFLSSSRISFTSTLSSMGYFFPQISW